MITIAFDVYGTLINTHGLVSKLDELLGDFDRAKHFSITWRDKQLEYSFRRGLMRQYQDFSVCTSNALDYCCAYYNVNFSQENKNELLSSYSVLPAFDDVSEGLKILNNPNLQGYAFSNGSKKAVKGLLNSAGIESMFDGVISVENVKTFKPNPDVYTYFLEQTNSIAENTWLVSSNPFDVIGAISMGMKSAWIQRSEEIVFDPWGIEPTITISSLIDLGEAFQKTEI